MTSCSTTPSPCVRPRGSGAAANPFSSSRGAPGVVPLVGHSAPELCDRLARLGGIAQVTGPHGAGKSTLLAHLSRELRARGESPRIVRASRSTWPLPTRCSVLVVDEADTLPSWKRAALRLACRLSGTGLLLCVHADAGLPTLVRMDAGLSTARGVVEHLCSGWAVRVPRDDELAGLLARHEGNLRSVLFTLYDWYEQGRLCVETGE